MPPYQPAAIMGSTNRMKGAASASAGCNDHRSSATTATDTIANPYRVPIRRLENDIIHLLTPCHVSPIRTQPYRKCRAHSPNGGPSARLRKFCRLEIPASAKVKDV